MIEFIQAYQDKPGIREVLHCLKQAQVRSYFVGGAVRDWLLGERTWDLDIVVMDWPPAFVECIRRQMSLHLSEASPFLTYRVVLPSGGHIDLARARKERYPHPGALPEVKPTDQLHEDLGRRDFTINAMAIEIYPDAGRFHDPFGGRTDLSAGWIRVLHQGSFQDDPTRAFRAIRYAVRFGFRYAPETEQEWDHARAVLPEISFERIKNEFKRMTLESQAVGMVQEIHRLQLLESYRPEFRAQPEALKILPHIPRTDESDWVLLFAPFCLHTPKIFELSLTREERKFFQDLHALLHAQDLGTTFEEIHRRWKSTDTRALRFAALYKRHPLLQEYAEKREQTRLSITGQYLRDLGIEGQKVGEILDRLFVEKLKGRLTSLQEELRYLHDILLKSSQ